MGKKALLKHSASPEEFWVVEVIENKDDRVLVHTENCGLPDPFEVCLGIWKIKEMGEELSLGYYKGILPTV